MVKISDGKLYKLTMIKDQPRCDELVMNMEIRCVTDISKMVSMMIILTTMFIIIRIMMMTRLNHMEMMRIVVKSNL